MKFKFFKTALSVAIFSIALLHTVPVGAKTVTPKKIQVSGFSKIFLGTSGEVVASRKNKVSTNQKLYVNFSPKNTKNIGIHVKSSDSSVLEVKKVSKHKFQFKALKEGKATLTITSQYKSKSGKSLSVRHELKVEKDKTFQIKQDEKNQFLMTLASPVDKVEHSDLKILSSDGKALTIQSALLSEDKRQISVTTKEDFVNQTEYTVTFGGFSTSFTAKVEQILPTSLTIKTKEVKKGEPTALEVEFLDENGNNITEVVDKAGLSITAEVEKGSYDTASNLLSIADYNGKAKVTADFRLPNGSSLSATAEVKVILEEEYQKQAELEAQWLILSSLPKGPTIKNVKFENVSDQWGGVSQIFTLTMTEEIKDSDKDRYKEKDNYEITLIDNFNGTSNTIPLNSANIKISEEKITIEFSGTVDGQIHNGNITFQVRTKGNIPSSTGVFSKDLREKNKLKFDKTNFKTFLTLDENNKNTLQLTFEAPTEGKLEGLSGTLQKNPSIKFSDDKKTLTFKFDDDYTYFSTSDDKKTITFTILIPNGYETYLSVIDKNKKFEVVLTSNVNTHNNTGTVTSVSFTESIQLIED